MVHEDLISCIMVTRGRPERAARAVEMFLAQTWPRKELFVMADVRSPGASELRERLARCGPEVRFFTPQPVETYVVLRNLGIALSSGDVLCMWDDDDLYHPTRLEAQHDDMVAAGAAASFIGDFMHLMEGEPEPRMMRYPWGGHPGTLMALRSARPVYPETPGLERGRDSIMQADLSARVPTTILYGKPHLYTYVFHGGNVWDKTHHEELARKCGRLYQP